MGINASGKTEKKISFQGNLWFVEQGQKLFRTYYFQLYEIYLVELYTECLFLYLSEVSSEEVIRFLYSLFSFWKFLLWKV